MALSTSLGNDTGLNGKRTGLKSCTDRVYLAISAFAGVACNLYIKNVECAARSVDKS